MIQSKFSLADVLTVLTALGFGFICFLSTNFFTLGNTKQSVILSAIVTVLLIGMALGAKLLKRTSRNFKTCFVWEMILLVLFAAFAVIFANSPFPHYFAVSDNKEEIQNKVAASITQAQKMFAEYERYAANRENLYRSRLRSVVAAKRTNPGDYKSFGFQDNGVADEKQIENKMFTVHADLFPSNYTDMKHADSIWLAQSQNTIENWKPIGLVSVVNNVEQNSKNWLSDLIKLSTVRGQGEQAEDFVYELSFDDVKTYFITFGKPSLLSIALSVAAYALMLLSYFITGRSSKTTIGKAGKNNSKYTIEF
jgi:hypothetical protein